MRDKTRNVGSEISHLINRRAHAKESPHKQRLKHRYMTLESIKAFRLKTMTTVSPPPSPNTPPEAFAGQHAMDLNSPATESVRSEATRMPQSNNSWLQATQPEYPMLPFNPWQQTQSPYVQHNPFSQLQMPQMPPIAPTHQMYQQQLFQAMNPMYQPGYYQQQSVMPDRIFMPPGFPPMPRPMDPSTRRSPAPNPAGPAVTLSADATAFRDNLLRQAADPDLLERAVANEKRMLADKLAEEHGEGYNNSQRGGGKA